MTSLAVRTSPPFRVDQHMQDNLSNPPHGSPRAEGLSIHRELSTNRLNNKSIQLTESSQCACS